MNQELEKQVQELLRRVQALENELRKLKTQQVRLPLDDASANVILDALKKKGLTYP